MRDRNGYNWKPDYKGAGATTGATIVFGSIFLIAFIVVSSYFEAQAYNRITGANVSTWDAIWLELRVQEGAK